jgi:SARP family transcriptional regulator, regulator of embCAB operon
MDAGTAGDTSTGDTAPDFPGPDFPGRDFTVEVFGHTTVRTPQRTLRASDFTGVKPRQLLELIALGKGEPVRKAALAEQVWAGRPPARWPVTLESYVALVRRAMQPGVPGRATVLRTTTGGYRLDVDRVRLDLHEFDALHHRAAAAAPSVALPLWERALRLAEGPLLATEPYAAWAVDARRVHERTLYAAAVGAAEAALAVGLPERAVPPAFRATEVDPLAEQGWQVLIRAQLAAGRRAEATHAFHTCRRGLRRELGVEPDRRTWELYTGALGHALPA